MVFRGSVLGPLLFILMINDLPTTSNSVNTYLYADDIAVKQKEQNLHQCNEELSKIRNWLKIIKLTLNIDRTISINFNRQKNNHRNRQYKNRNWWLGIHTGAKLDFKFHIHFLVKEWRIFVCDETYKICSVKEMKYIRAIPNFRKAFTEGFKNWNPKKLNFGFGDWDVET